MADLSFPTSVVPSSSAIIQRKIAAAAIAAGELVYINTSGLAAVAQGDDSATSTVFGMAMNTAAANQEVQIATEGSVSASGAAMVVGEAYFLSQSTAGDLQPSTDNAAGDIANFIGIATSATALYIKILNAQTVLGT